jgi:mono/diheme cytochrome c family protein
MIACLTVAGACSEEKPGERANPSPPPAAPAASPAPAAPLQSAAPPAPAASASPAQASPAQASAAPVDGKVVFATFCATCHGPEGKGDGPGGVALDPKPRDFTAGKFKFDPTGDGKTGELEDIVEVVKNGAAKFGGSPNMVAWSAALSDAQIQAVAKYVKSLGPS